MTASACPCGRVHAGTCGRVVAVVVASSRPFAERSTVERRSGLDRRVAVSMARDAFESRALVPDRRLPVYSGQLARLLLTQRYGLPNAFPADRVERDAATPFGWSACLFVDDSRGGAPVAFWRPDPAEQRASALMTAYRRAVRLYREAHA